MTDQELFDTVAKHLLTQMRRSAVYPEELDSACLYRSEDGCRCAVGVLIPDDKYYASLEGKSACDEAVIRACGLTSDRGDLVEELQTVHDSYWPYQWRQRLQEVAIDRGLSTTVVDA